MRDQHDQQRPIECADIRCTDRARHARSDRDPDADARPDTDP